MRVVEIRTVIEQVLGQIPFEPPLLSYCEAVWKELHTRLPKASVEVFHRHVDLNVRVAVGKAVCNVKLPLV